MRKISYSEGRIGRNALPPCVLEKVGETMAQFARHVHQAREERFFEYLFDLFTVDPYRKSMQPGLGWPPANRNNASWRGFWLSDAELQALVRETFTVYVESKPAF